MVNYSYLKLKLMKICVLCNVYAPTQNHKCDQINFLIDVKNSLSTYQNENILLGCNFDLHLNSKLDKIDSMSNKNDNIEYVISIRLHEFIRLF